MNYQDINNAYEDLAPGVPGSPEILAMYAQVPDKKAAFGDGNTLLHLAAAHAHLEAVEYLLGEGCDPDAKNEDGRSPLWPVAMLDESEPDFPAQAVAAVTTALLRAGASPMQQDGDGTWLHQEAAENESETYLAAVHAYLQNIQNAEKEAARKLEEQVTLRQIKSAYADLRYGRKTAEEILAMYEALADRKAAEEYGDTPLHVAAANLHLDAVKYLLAEGCDPNATNDYGRTPLWSAALLRELVPTLPENAVFDVTTALLEAGASPMKKDGSGNWCYLEAAKNGNGEFIAALHAKGARITRTDDNGNNGLHFLIESLYNPINDFSQAEKRYQKSVEENAHESTIERDKKLLEERKVLMDYRLETAFKGVQALIEAGVDPEDKNNMGETAHKLAERRGAKKIGAFLKGDISAADSSEESSGGSGANQAALLEKAGGMSLIQATGKADHEAIRALAELGVDLNEVGDIYGYGEGTALAMACRDCDYQTVELLLELGADPNFKAGNGTTAISWFSAKHGNVQKIFQENRPAKLVDAMVKAGMEVNATVDDKSNSLLTWALRDKHDMEMFLTGETFRWLVVNSAIVHGADVNWANIDGETALMLTCRANPGRDMRMAEEIQMLLLENGANVAAKDKNGNTPLIYAAQNGSESAAKNMSENLFDFGDPEPGAVNNAGKSALDYATQKNNEMLVKFLLQNM